MTARNSLYISTMSREGPGGKASCAVPASAVWAGATRAYYYPLLIENPGTVYQFFWLNGTVAGTDNIQVGLYLPDGTDGGPSTALKRGTSTLASGTNVCQYDNITDQPVSPGLYWLGVWSSGITTTMFRVGVAARWTGYYSESSLAGGLGATAVPVQPAASTIVVAGLVMRASP